MNAVTIDLEALRHNLEVVNRWVRGADASLTVVTKALCGHQEVVKALRKMGVRSMADSRLENIELLGDAPGDAEQWYLRPPHRSQLGDLVRLTHASLNSELEVVRAIDREARRQNRVHGVVVMIELGDLREGILPGKLVDVYEEIFRLENVRVLGVGANLGCLSGAIPSVDELMQLVLYRELLELKFKRAMPLVSAGTSAVLPLLLQGQLPRSVNHFRVGESILLGTDLINGGTIEGLRGDVVTVEAEVVEVKHKSLVPSGETTEMAPFAAIEGDEELAPGQRGWRALVNLGQVDTEVSALTPVNPAYRIAGASSDITVVNVGDEPDGLEVGDAIRFRPGYSAMVRLMGNRYTEVRLRPDLDEQTGARVGLGPAVEIPPVMTEDRVPA